MSELPPSGDVTQKFGDATSAVRAYNATTGSIFSLVSAYEGLIPNPTSPLTISDRVAMQRDMTNMLHPDDLLEMGVELVDLNNNVYGEMAESDPPKSLRMRIADTDRFNQTVRELTPASGQQEHIEQGINTILNTTVDLVRIAYSGSSSDDEQERRDHRRAADVELERFVHISHALIEQGFGELTNHKTLFNYAVQHGLGTLPEYIGAEERDLLRSSEEFGPGSWQTDATGEQFIERWSGVFDYLRTLRDMGTPFYWQLFKKVRSDFDIASAEIVASSKDDPYYSELSATLPALNAVWENDFPFENTSYIEQFFA